MFERQVGRQEECAGTCIADTLRPAVLLKHGATVLLEDALHFAVLQNQFHMLAVEHKPLQSMSQSKDQGGPKGGARQSCSCLHWCGIWLLS